MIDFSTLPDFSPDGFELQTLELGNSSIAEVLPQDEPFVWLESHSQGQRFIFWGSTWTLSIYHDHIQSQINDREQRLNLTGPLNYPELLNQLEASWLPRQPEAFKMSWALSYEAGWNWEKRRQTQSHPPTPELWLCCPKYLIFQNHSGAPLQVLRPKHLPELQLKPQRTLTQNFAKAITLSADQDKASYLEKIQKVKQHIREGDSFQVNLSQGFQGKGQVDLYSWAHHAFKSQASSFGACIKTKTFSMLSLSPERLIAQEGQTLITRPIAGTLPVSQNDSPERLKAFKEHPKELAEHNMLIDLERNDLGKISQAGSVKVEEYLTIESLPHVHHLVSQVIGNKTDQAHFGDILQAMFPGGTITGCPKLETMHIIDALEQGHRSFYTGSLGYLGQTGFDSNILIRTATLYQNAIYMRFGGGLVWDSDPEKEYLETLAKARGLLRSLIEGGADFDLDHRSFRQFFA